MGKSPSSFLAIGGTKFIYREEYLKKAKLDLEHFFLSRSSVRQYSSDDVSKKLIIEAIRMAQKTPCVCNRQSWKVHLFKNKENITDALRIQGGAAGFDESINSLIVISSELAYFQSPGERYQGWIEGGLFSMSLIYAIHSLGLVSCCLNWSKNKEIDIQFKNKFDIPESHSIIMLLSVGYPKEEFLVAESWRKPIDTILTSDT